MKNLLIILASLAVLAVASLAGVALYLFFNGESEKNKARTAPAREARWAKEKSQEADLACLPMDLKVSDEPNNEPNKVTI